MHVVAKADHVVALSGGRVEFSGSSADFMRTPLYASLAAAEAAEAAAAADHESGKAAGDGDGDAAAAGEPAVGGGAAAPAPAAAAAPGDSGTITTSTTDAAASVSAAAAASSDAAATQLMTAEEKASGGVPWSTYLEYFKFCGGRVLTISIIIMFTLTEAITVATVGWLSLWTARRFELSDTVYMWGYIGVSLSTAVVVPLRFGIWFTVMRRCGAAVHGAMLRSVSRGTMEFFDTTPLGRMLNRFSRDVDVADSSLPSISLQFLNCIFGVGSMMVVVIATQPATLIVLTPCAYICYRIMVLYNSANREIRRTSSVVKSPLFSLLGEALTGSATITAYHRASTVMAEALQRLDVVYSCSILESAAGRWLGVRIDILSNVVITSVVLVGVATTILSDTSAHWVALVSLSLTMSTNCTMFLIFLVKQGAALEADMNGVERLLYYTREVPQEDMPELDEEVAALAARAGDGADATGTVVVEPAGPAGAVTQAVQAGSLVFDGVQMRYREGLPLVLRDVSFRIAPREKVGVVGRTGSGKSTLLLTFLRMVEVCGGSIAVNGRAIGAYGLRELRRQFSMIPQDPVLFDGTVRLNVDPFLEASAAEVWAALELVGLRERVAAEAEGIDSRVLEGGSNYSVGQRQLMCMARALLKKGSGFILMDEATANIDPALDRQIQTTVMSAFAAYTVITIAHRLHTVAQYDKIIVMDHGVVAEMGSPRELVTDRHSVFRGMVEALGPSESARVMQLMAASGSSAASR
ncbi:pentamidine resistance protein 1 [Novymonas esmeraldas]|uniref:Pentamidine resistance protein 1 n=1 Tax=Novymonas esmeraldas TaxID=1808958 RepID=A0AAW0EQA3_9TRYP